MPDPDLTGETQPFPDMLQSRSVALAVLDRVFAKKLPLDQVLADNADMMALEPRDRAFARMIVATVLRRLGQIDDLIMKASTQGGAPNPPLLHHILRIGVAQMAFMNVPHHAAVDTSVSLAEANQLGRQKGFVNAVLRRLTREGHGWLTAQSGAIMNIPAWLYQVWQQDYGDDIAQRIAEASMEEAPLDLTMKDPAGAAHWASLLGAAILPTGSLRRAAGGNVQELPGYTDGTWWVQDASAALPARLLGDVTGWTIADLCAAPGGKTAQLAAGGANVIALDRSARRIRRLDENMQRLGFDGQVTTEAADAALWRPRDLLDAVLLDAPCTATGTIRRHPDVTMQKSAQDMAALAALQSSLLDNAATMLKPCGALIYCTCSLQKDEGERQIDAFLKRAPFMQRKPITVDEIGGLAELMTPDGDVRILPIHLADQGGMDGFYVARLQRQP